VLIVVNSQLLKSTHESLSPILFFTGKTTKIVFQHYLNYSAFSLYQHICKNVFCTVVTSVKYMYV